MGVLRVSGVNSVSSAEIRRLSKRQFSPDPSKLTLKTLKTPPNEETIDRGPVT